MEVKGVLLNVFCIYAEMIGYNATFSSQIS